MELLAVIVILAIIALIAVPIIVNIIKDTKEKAMQINAQNYMDAVELAVADGHMVKGEKVLISGTYDIIENGKVIKLIKDENDKPILEESNKIEIPVKYTGEGLKSGTVKLIDGKVRKVTDVMTNEDYHVLIILGEVKIFKKVNPATLTTGIDFNSKIKTLVSGTDAKYNSTDTIVKSIEFLAYGLIPSGYTLEEFQKLERVDISLNSDETIYAIYDGNEKVYVYAEEEIIFNKASKNMFQNFDSVETILFGEYINTSNVKDMYGMFAGCSSLTSLDVSNFNTSNVTNVAWMFEKCISLALLNLVSFDTSNITNMSGMFQDCSNLRTIELSSFNTSKVSAMQAMFNKCSSLIELDVSNFDTSQVTNMTQMFNNCSNLNSLNLNNFDTSKVTSMHYMFENCSNLSKLYISNFNTSQVTTMQSMFMWCSNLNELDLRSFDMSIVTNVFNMLTHTPNLKPIYVGEKFILNESIDPLSIMWDSKTKGIEEFCKPNNTEDWCVVAS